MIAIEDAQRILLLDAPEKGISWATVDHYIDRFKYSLRHGIERIVKETKDFSHQKLPQRPLVSPYERGQELAMAGVEFSVAAQICSAAHSKQVSLRTEENVIWVESGGEHEKIDMAYAALEMLGHHSPEIPSPFGFIGLWVRHPENAPEVVHWIADSTSVKNKLITYEYQLQLAIELSQQIAQLNSIIPIEWEFEWGGRNETILLLNALTIRCIYHFVAVHFGSIKHKLKGVGYADICLCTSPDSLAIELYMMSSLSHASINSFIKNLTYGTNSNTPDPALQPFIPVNKNTILLACMHIISCNQERNLLSLQTRIDTNRFNSLSHNFEKHMVSNIADQVSSKWSYTKANKLVKLGGTTEEIDLIIADPLERVILVCELRWTIQPGDPREVQNRKKACLEKIAQLERKVEFVRSNPKQIFEQVFGTQSNIISKQDWRINGIVIVEGFGGLKSRLPDYPIMTTATFIVGMQTSTSLLKFHDWSTSLVWLPQIDVHYESTEEEITLEERTVRYDGVRLLKNKINYIDYVISTVPA